MEAKNALKQYNELALLDDEQLVKQITTAVKNGDVSPLDVHLSMKRMEKVQKGVLADKDVKNAVLEEAKTHKESGQFEYKNAKLSVSPTRTWYDFSETNDLYYNRLIELKQTIDASVKEREEYLKTLIPNEKALSVSKTTIVVEQLPTIEMIDCGEEVVVNPPIKKQTMGVKTSFIKNWELRKREELK